MTSEWIAFKVTLVATVDVLALLGNILLFVVLLRKPTSRTQTNAFILNLAAADLLVATLNMPLIIATLIHGDWMFDEFVCRLSAFLNLLSFVASVMSLAMVSVNRYHFVVKWKTYRQYFSWQRCAVYITLVWLFSGFLCVPPLLGWATYRFIAEQSLCFVDWSSSVSYLFSMAAVCLLGPASTMAFSYWSIWTFTSSSAKRLESRGKLEENRIDITGTAISLDPTIGVFQHTGQEDNSHIQYYGSSVPQDKIVEIEDPQQINKSIASSLAAAIRGDGCNQERASSQVFPASHQHCTHTFSMRTPPCSPKNRRQEDTFRRHTSVKRLPYSAQHLDAKLTRTLLIIVVAFCLCWAPYTITCVLQVSLSSPIPTAVWFGVMWSGCANSACNVLIYISTSTKVRKEFLDMLKEWLICRSRKVSYPLKERP